MRIALVCLSLLLMVLCYKLFVSHDGISQIHQLQSSLELQKNKNNLLETKNNALMTEIRDLKHSHHAVEAHARHDLGMIKNDEKFYQFVKKHK